MEYVLWFLCAAWAAVGIAWIWLLARKCYKCDGGGCETCNYKGMK